jgi:hypothetical protein
MGSSCCTRRSAFDTRETLRTPGMIVDCGGHRMNLDRVDKHTSARTSHRNESSRIAHQSTAVGQNWLSKIARPVRPHTCGLTFDRPKHWRRDTAGGGACRMKSVEAVNWSHITGNDVHLKDRSTKYRQRNDLSYGSDGVRAGAIITFVTKSSQATFDLGSSQEVMQSKGNRR